MSRAFRPSGVAQARRVGRSVADRFAAVKSEVRPETGYLWLTATFRLLYDRRMNNSIIEALGKVITNAAKFDVIIIIRGGGSQVELDCFDAYELAATIAKCGVPVITGIGHERDETITDMVAHTALKTPTAVGEFLLNGVSQFEASLNEYLVRIRQRYERLLRTQELVLNERYHTLGRLIDSLVQKLRNGINSMEERIELFSKGLLDRQWALLEKMQSSIQLSDPKLILKRGYTITILNGKPIREVKHVEKGQELVTIASNLEINSIVKQIDKINEK